MYPLGTVAMIEVVNLGALPGKSIGESDLRYAMEKFPHLKPEKKFGRFMWSRSHTQLVAKHFGIDLE